MLDFIPLDQYTPLFYYALLALTAGIFLHSYLTNMESPGSIKIIRNTALFLFLGTIFYMGLRPVSGQYFGDMAIYAKRFNRYQQGFTIIATKDVAFQLFIKVMALSSNMHIFFLTCAALYIVPLYKASKNFFSSYWGYGFIILLASMSFWPYGTNGIRNGIATSFFILALAYQNKHFFFVLLLVLSCAFHKSMLLPTLALTLTFLHNNPKSYFVAWFLAIPLSLAFEGFWESFFGSFGFDERFSYFTDDTYADQFSRIGFRWDFLLYSATGVFAAWYFIYKKKYTDAFYYRLVNIFLLSNAFWVLVIRSSFSNRFAYLSWFMLGLVIIYPLLKNRLFERQHRVIGNILIIYFLFSFALNVVLS